MGGFFRTQLRYKSAKNPFPCSLRNMRSGPIVAALAPSCCRSFLPVWSNTGRTHGGSTATSKHEPTRSMPVEPLSALTIVGFLAQSSELALCRAQPEKQSGSQTADSGSSSVTPHSPASQPVSPAGWAGPPRWACVMELASSLASSWRDRQTACVPSGRLGDNQHRRPSKPPDIIDGSYGSQV